MSSKQKRPFRYLHREWPVEWPAIVTISRQQWGMADDQY